MGSSWHVAGPLDVMAKLLLARKALTCFDLVAGEILIIFLSMNPGLFLFCGVHGKLLYGSLTPRREGLWWLWNWFHLDVYVFLWFVTMGKLPYPTKPHCPPPENWFPERAR